MRSQFTRRNKVGLILGILALVFLGASVPPRIIVSPTPSDGKHIFFRLPPRLEIGSYVVFPAKTDLVDKCREGCLLLKRIVCGPGQVLEVRGRDFYCDGVFLGRAKEKSRKGVPVEPFRWSGRIPERKYFVMGSHADSYDSRYFGFVDAGAVTASAVPLL